MRFWSRSDGMPDIISSDQLAEFGRRSFVKYLVGLPKDEPEFPLVAPLEAVACQSPAGRARVIAELGRHAADGDWQKVGAWKFAAWHLQREADVAHLIDGGLLAISRMRVTNLGRHLNKLDAPRYRQLTGLDIPDDGFWGPPVFDSSYGPGRQYYLDSAVTAASRRSVTRLPHVPGEEPRPISKWAVIRMDNLGRLVYLGPLMVEEEHTNEPVLMGEAIAAATDVDHVLFADRLSEAMLAPSGYGDGVWSHLGAARFVEDYLHADARNARGYQALLDSALRLLLKEGPLGFMVAPEVLTPIQRARLGQIQGDG
jgi:hypothetical protein